MTEELLTSALPGLRRALGLEEDDEGLAVALELAEEEICRYLNRDSLPEGARCLLIELAALKYLRMGENRDKKSESYSEGQLSQSESYFTPEEFREGEEALLRALAPLRRVRCKGDRA